MLAAASINAHIDIQLQNLAPPVDELFGWVMRERVTNMLRHSQAANCSIRATRQLAGALETGEIPLTSRETGPLRAAEAGISTDEIAKSLALSSTTVRNYLSNAITKVGGRNRIDAIRIARDAGWL